MTYAFFAPIIRQCLSPRRTSVAAHRPSPPAADGLLLYFLLIGILAPNVGFCESGARHLDAYAEGDLYGYMDSFGNVVIPAQYVIAGKFSSSGIASVVDEGGWAIINASGELLLRPFVVDNGPDQFHEGLARFVDAGRVGYFSITGDVVIPATFDCASYFSEGLAAVCRGCRTVRDGEYSYCQGGEWSYIRPDGAKAFDGSFDAARPFSNGLAKVKHGGSWHRIDRSGRSYDQ